MKKLTAALLALALMLSLCACGGGGGKDAAPAKPEDVKGQTYDTGMFTALTPTGWYADPASDVFDEYDGDTNPTGLTLIKGGKDSLDILSKPYVKIDIYEDGRSFSMKSWYDDVVDLDPVTIAGFKYERYTCTSSDYPYTMLEGSNGTTDIDVAILTKNTDGEISFDDIEVQAILQSIKIK